jgi:nicotinic acid mononucleotide adenylyltransferase
MPREELRCDALNAVPGLSSLSGKAASVIKRIAADALSDLRSMREVLGESACEPDFSCLSRGVALSLAHIGQHIMEGRAIPWVKVNHHPSDPPVPPVSREMRLGVFPVAGNPFHWAHLLGGLLTMEAFELDKILYVVAGSDPRKPDLAPIDARHAMASALLRLFRPLFEYSSIARGDSSSGEENLFRILAMNPGQPIHAYYIAGGDHYHRFEPMTGDPDTLEKLETGIARAGTGFDDRVHRVSAVFLEREPVKEMIPTSLDILWVRGLPVQTSSTGIRRALTDREQREKLCTLPYTAYTSIRGNQLYNTGSCEETALQAHL